MDNATHLGLDVHKDTIAVAVLRPGALEPDERVIPNTLEALRTLVGRARSKGRLVACYEAGPTGYHTYRLLASLEVSFPAEPPSEPHLVLETAPEVLAELLAGYLTIDSAVGSGRVRVDGPKREARRFFEIFHLPSRVQAPGEEALAGRRAP